MKQFFMAAEQWMNQCGNEPSGNNKKERDTSPRGVQRVDFDEVNFEQRRAPYNSGSKTLAEKEYTKNRGKSGSGGERENL